MTYLVILILVMFLVDIVLHINFYRKKKEIKEEHEEEQQEISDYTCFICEKKFSSNIIYRQNRALCSDDCKKQFVKGGFK